MTCPPRSHAPPTVPISTVSDPFARMRGTTHDRRGTSTARAGKRGVMTYTGEVTPGGSPEVRELGSLTITKLAVDEKMSNNCYLLTCRSSGAQVLIDAAAEAERLLPLIGEGGLSAVVTTHQHWDHHRALGEVVKATGAEVVAGAPDAAAITEQTGVEVTRPVGQGDVVAVGDCTLEVIAIAGHTPGSIALLHVAPEGHPHLFTGDS